MARNKSEAYDPIPVIQHVSHGLPWPENNMPPGFSSKHVPDDEEWPHWELWGPDGTCICTAGGEGWLIGRAWHMFRTGRGLSLDVFVIQWDGRYLSKGALTRYIEDDHEITITGKEMRRLLKMRK